MLYVWYADAAFSLKEETCCHWCHKVILSLCLSPNDNADSSLLWQNTEHITIYWFDKHETSSTHAWTWTHLPFSFLYDVSNESRYFYNIRYNNFWAVRASVNKVFSFIHQGWSKKKVRKRMFNLVSTTWVIIRNDSWTWWNCIPNWKTKLLSDRHDFLVLGPC